MYAIIKTGGKQIKVCEGDEVFIERLDIEEGNEVTFDEVLLVDIDGKVKVGTPFVKGAKVTASVSKQGKAKKVLVFRYRAKHNVRKLRGHRQPYSKVKITSITA